MKALRIKDRQLSVKEIDKPKSDSEALVRVILSGICNTDLEIAKGYADFEGTPGHEFVGVIEEKPAAFTETGPLVGQRVVGEINAGCGTCDLCREGDSRHCLQRTVLGIVGRDGSHAQYLKLPVRNLLPVPTEISDERAVFTEPLAAACGILERVAIDEAMQTAVIGDGKLGLLCGQVIATVAPSVKLIGKHSSKLRIADRLGIETATIEPAKSLGRQFDLVVDASGSPSGFQLALDLLRPRGLLVLKSTFHGTTLIESARIVVDEISVVGSRCGRFAPALELLKQGAVVVDELISEEFPLVKGVQAMARAAQEGVLKVLLRP